MGGDSDGDPQYLNNKFLALMKPWNAEVVQALLLLRKTQEKENPLSGVPRDVIVYCIYDWLNK